jgi:hypothetical protein
MRCMLAPASLALAAIVAVACGEQSPNALEEAALNVAPASEAAAQGASQTRNFVATLDGDQEVSAVPVVTRGTGSAHFQLSRDGTELSYRLIVSNIENVTMSHIHLAPAGANGPVVVWLYPSGPPPQLIAGRTQGILAEGTITDASLVGPLAGMTLDDLLAAIRAGNAYVNVHTLQYPPGEIRGQIMAPRETGGMGRLLR